MRRRTFIAGAAAVIAGPFACEAQPARKPALGFLSSTLPRSAPFYRAFEQRLNELGYEDGRSIDIHFRTAGGNAARLPELAAELARLQVDLVVAAGPEAPLRAARQVFTTTPIVMVAIDFDPVAHGYVGSLARPGGTVTGVFVRQLELTRKRLDLLTQTIANLTRVAVLWDAFSADQLREAETTARAIGLQLQPLEGDAWTSASWKGVQAILILASPVFFRDRDRLLKLARAQGLPTMAAQSEWADSGALLTYGASYQAMFRRGADFVDKVLKGSRPADLPVEQPTRFELIVNMSMAKALGLTIPPSVLLRADRVIT